MSSDRTQPTKNDEITRAGSHANPQSGGPVIASESGASLIARYAEASLPTLSGNFRVLVYRTEDGSTEALAVLGGNGEEALKDADPVLARVHSECMTGEVLGSLRCDCRAQLELGLSRIESEGGVLIYLRQEGRGIGLANKIRAYGLQDAGADTVDANLALGFAADERDYSIAAAILTDLGVRSLRLMTNNPRKVDALLEAGFEVTQEPHWTEPVEEAAAYLETKRSRLGHLSTSSADRATDKSRSDATSKAEVK